jgi:hypothetical protein
MAYLAILGDNKSQKPAGQSNCLLLRMRFVVHGTAATRARATPWIST